MTDITDTNNKETLLISQTKTITFYLCAILQQTSLNNINTNININCSRSTSTDSTHANSNNTNTTTFLKTRN